MDLLIGMLAGVGLGSLATWALLARKSPKADARDREQRLRHLVLGLSQVAQKSSASVTTSGLSDDDLAAASVELEVAAATIYAIAKNEAPSLERDLRGFLDRRHPDSPAAADDLSGWLEKRYAMLAAVTQRWLADPAAHDQLVPYDWTS